mgnify:CR=1 FL=1
MILDPMSKIVQIPDPGIFDPIGLNNTPDPDPDPKLGFCVKRRGNEAIN